MLDTPDRKKDKNNIKKWMDTYTQWMLNHYLSIY